MTCFLQEKETKKTAALCTNPDGVSSQEEENDIIKGINYCVIFQ